MGIGLELTKKSAKNTQRWWQLTATIVCGHELVHVWVFQIFLPLFADSEIDRIHVRSSLDHTGH